MITKTNKICVQILASLEIHHPSMNFLKKSKTFPKERSFESCFLVKPKVAHGFFGIL